MRSALRYLISSLLVGALSVGLAWAGARLVPVESSKVGGFFDRKFLSSPAEVRTGKSPDTAPCESASPVSVEVAATAAFVGHQLAITAGPGDGGVAVVNYEDSYSIDRCFGDKVREETIALLNQLRE